jgi:hypothetical protein
MKSTQKKADLATATILLNSTISTPGAKRMKADIIDFYRNTPMTQFEYMKVPRSLFPSDIIAYHQLENISHKGFTYCEIQKGMYGLPQVKISKQ